MYHCLIFVAWNEFDFCLGGGQLSDYVILIFTTVGLREIRSWYKLLSDNFIQGFSHFTSCLLTIQPLAAESNGTFIWQTLWICNSRYCLLIILKVGNTLSILFSFLFPLVVISFPFYLWIVNIIPLFTGSLVQFRVWLITERLALREHRERHLFYDKQLWVRQFVIQIPRQIGMIITCSEHMLRAVYPLWHLCLGNS